MTQKANAFETAISLNRDVYKALAAIDVSKADPATRYYVQRTFLSFAWPVSTKMTPPATSSSNLRTISPDKSPFDRNIADDQRSVEITGAAELDGLPQDYIDHHKPGADGKIRITTDYPDVFPVLNFGKTPICGIASMSSSTTAPIPRITTCS